MVQVSIGIPAFNAGAMLFDAIRSVLAQTLADWELIIVDDGSRDRTAEALAGLRDPRIRVLVDGVNRGLVARLNQITAEARGEFLARMDADDLMHPERLERQIAFLREHRDVDVVGTGICSIDAESRPIGIRWCEELDMSPFRVLEHGGIIHPTIMARTRWFQENPYDPAFPRAEDRELWCRCLRRGTRFANIGEPLFFYREVDVHDLRKYLKSYESNRKLHHLHGPALVGLFRTFILLSRSHAKSMMLKWVFALKAQSVLFERRCGKKLTADETRRFGDVLHHIRSIDIPGLGVGMPMNTDAVETCPRCSGAVFAASPGGQ